MSEVQLRDVAPTDVEALLALNNASVPNVNHLSYRTMTWYVENAPYFRVSVIDDQVVGFLVGLTRDVPYDSSNFLKFKKWFADFVYVDRIAVAANARRNGVARLLYEDIERCARSIASRITCEVNLRPRNASSLTFHRRLGFAQVGTQKTEGGSKTVALLVKPLSRNGAADSSIR